VDPLEFGATIVELGIGLGLVPGAGRPLCPITESMEPIINNPTPNANANTVKYAKLIRIYNQYSII
jgi:hypothetical protein